MDKYSTVSDQQDILNIAKKLEDIKEESFSDYEYIKAYIEYLTQKTGEPVMSRNRISEM